MVFKIEIDYSEVEAMAKRLDATADQIPFAMALAMNRSADVTRRLLVQMTWPQHIQARNASFISASLTTRDARASKGTLSVEIYDKLNRGNLVMQSKGGTRSPLGGSNLAVPSSAITRTSRGVPQRFRPKNMPTAVRKGDVLYAKDKKGKLTLMYVLKHQTRIPKRVPFYEDYESSMRRELNRTIPLAFEQAMRTRRR
jgi:hypothetical protein